MKDKWKFASKESRGGRVLQSEKACGRALGQEVAWHMKSPQIIYYVYLLVIYVK